jgi:ABC-type oligopeptide transport system ATPase subunit
MASSKLALAKIRRFQSIEEADVDLGDLTVIVGASNSGKSAFGRALRALARNTAGSGHVTLGHKSAIIAAKTQDGTTILLERGAGTSTYRTVANGKEEAYTKAGTNVPDDIKAILRMPEGSPDAHFTTQFDGPFLLDANGTTAQRVLGELTNVTVLAEAAREANRRRLERHREATMRRKDAEAAALEVRTRHGSLPARRKAATEARELLNALTDEMSRAERLQHFAEQVLTARKAAAASRARADQLKEALTDVEDFTSALEAALAKPAELTALAERAGKAARVASAQRDAATKDKERAESCEAELEESLDRLGLCPLCGTSRKSA